MSTIDFPFGLILLVTLASGMISSCLHPISCPCGFKKEPIYTQCANNTFDKKRTCERWANCDTCEANTSYCITCPQGRSGPTCAEDSTVNCPDPGSITFGYRRLMKGIPSRLSRKYSTGQSFQYFCNRDYELQGNNVLTCLTSGKWSSNAPWCKSSNIGSNVYCADPVGISFGSYRNSDGNTATSQWYAVGQSVIYYCELNYTLVGSKEITCMPTGTWSKKPLCKRIVSTPFPIIITDSTTNCSDPGSIENGYRRLVNGTPSKLSQIYNIGHAFQYFCNEGYELQGTNVITCSTSGTWTSNKPRCQISAIGEPERYCKFPQVNITGMIVKPIGQKFPPGTEIKFDCQDGYKLEGSNFMIFCKLNGEWTSEPPTCRRNSEAVKPTFVTGILCPNPIVDPNGDMEYVFPIDPRRKKQGYEAGSQVSFTCRSGYEIHGTNPLICLRNGQWTSKPPTCTRISHSIVECIDPGSIEHGGVIVRYNNPSARPLLSSDRYKTYSYPVGTQLIFDCIDGYRLEGERALNCRYPGRWSVDKPSCIKN